MKNKEKIWYTQTVISIKRIITNNYVSTEKTLISLKLHKEIKFISNFMNDNIDKLSNEFIKLLHELIETINNVINSKISIDYYNLLDLKIL